jgi:polygalacturonase
MRAQLQRLLVRAVSMLLLLAASSSSSGGACSMQRALAESRAASATARSAELLQQLALLGATEPADVLLLAEHELVAAGATVAGARRLRAAVAAACDDDTLANVTPQALIQKAVPVPVPFAQQVLSIRDFGAVGDNTADDTAAIQAALDAASCCPHTVGGPPGCRPQPCLSPASVFIPSGTYKITAALQVSAPVYGETATSSTIFNHGNGTDAFVLGAVGCE